ncbi:MAG: mechanosensitive ion channel family protein [Acidimicrobiales bacterium]
MTTLLAADTARQVVVSPGLSAADWVGAGVILAVGIGASALLRKGVRRSIHRGDSEQGAANAVTRLLGWLVFLAALFWSLSVLGVRLGPLFGALGIGGLAIAFAAQSILGNFLASIILQVRRPFRRGDQISTNDCEGIVEEVNFRTVRLRTYAGERVMVPCAEVLSNPITNHTTLGRRRTTLEVGVGYDTDLESCRHVLLAAVARADGVLDRPPPEVWVKEFGESSINLAVRFWHPPDTASLWRVRSAVAVALKPALDGAGIEMPFPQRVLSFSTADLPTAERRDPGDRAGGGASGSEPAASDPAAGDPPAGHPAGDGQAGADGTGSGGDTGEPRHREHHR